MGVSIQDMVKQALVHYSGGVQGVGFRYTARALASGFRVAGYVKNLTDGRVELVAEGEQAEVLAFLEAVDERMGDLVSSRDLRWSAPTGEWRGFGIGF